MNYDQFVQTGHRRYELFAGTVAAILQAAVDVHPQDFRLQQIKFRAKDRKSLKRKLAERALLESDVIEQELKDLAGCRLIFYTNTDVDRFLASRVIFDNFIVDFDGSKIHHAVGKERAADELYFAIHYLVSLKEDRLALPEYAQYRGMRCEVQIQTILNHAWAETSHDILYHPPSIHGFGTKQFEEVKSRLAKIMNQYLLPAGYEFQKVQHDYERLMQGKELFDRGTMEALAAATDNNERFEQLQRIRKQLLPLYDDIPAVAPELIRVASDAIKKGRAVTTTPIETAFGRLHGHTPEDVADQALQIIDDLRYVDATETFRVLCDLYVTAGSDEERRRILQSVETLARNRIDVWRHIGFGVQKVIYDAISGLPQGERKSLRPVIVTACRLFVDPELQGTTWRFDSVTLERGVVPASTGYGDFRRGAIAVLFDMCDHANSLDEKLEVIQALSTATRSPMDGGRPDLIELVLDNTQQIVEFFSKRVDTEPFEIVQHLEHQFLWLYRRSKQMAAPEVRSQLGVKARALVGAIERFRDDANNNVRYVRFKTLVGHESVFPPEWDSNGMDVERPQAYRSARIAEYAASISRDNAEEWYEIVELCTAVKSNDLATFPNLGEFLKEVATRSPLITIGWLERSEQLSNRFLPPILDGLGRSAERARSLLLVSGWIDEGQHLPAIARYLRFAEDTPVDLVAKAGHRAIALGDEIAVIEIIAAIIVRGLDSLVESLFVPAVRLLTGLNDTLWVDATWFMPSLTPFLCGLSEQQCQVILDNLIARERVDFHAEAVLQRIAAKHPRPVWNFFKARMDREDCDDSGTRYEAVPYGMEELRKPLAKDAQLAIEMVRSWYSPGDHLFTYTGGRLLHDVFPQFTNEFEAALSKLVRSACTGDVDFVLSILRSYEGGQFLHGICKELIDVIPEGDERIHEVEIILDSTGVVSGQFGMVQAYKNKKGQVQDWLSDTRPKVRDFAERYQRHLERAIAAEQRRSETDYELRRRDWPEEE